MSDSETLDDLNDQPNENDETGSGVEPVENVDSADSSTGYSSLTLRLADEVCAAIATQGLAASVEIVPTFYTGDDEKIVVSPDMMRMEREARVAVSESRVYKIVTYKRVDTLSVDDCVDTIEKLALFLAGTTFYVDDKTFATAEIEVDLVDADQLYQNFIYCGSVTITLTTGRAHGV